MKTKNRFILFTVSVVVSMGLIIPPAAHADVAPGDVILILGENLSATQKEQVLTELKVPKEAMEMVVTNAEEHQYLGNYLSNVQIGTKALSSAKIEIGEAGSGLHVETSHINWVTEDMYLNAMITAGVKDASVTITAPFDVSGTAALTGIIKAYEKSTNVKISEEQKQVANEEMVKSAELSDAIGVEETTTLMTNLKEEMAKSQPQSEEAMKTMIENKASELNIDIPADQLTGLTDLFMNMKEANINWNAVGDQLEKAKEQFTDFMNSDTTQGILSKIGEFFKGIFDAIGGWFS